jgi:hypothetical protein
MNLVAFVPDTSLSLSCMVCPVALAIQLHVLYFYEMFYLLYKAVLVDLFIHSPICLHGVVLN